MGHQEVDWYLNLPYHIEVVYDDSGEEPGWFASVAELQGCMTQADTFEELGEAVKSAMRSWIEVALEENIPIPEPYVDEEYSGKFVVRMPRSLHRQLAKRAERENTSLNQLVLALLAEGMGKWTAERKRDASRRYRDLSQMTTIPWMPLADMATFPSPDTSNIHWGDLDLSYRRIVNA
ncbi:MAG: type II toxin-antitoxin system HicB family antitoxin [Thermoflexales bacterium]|nr:type II toxin-antitoxin system HicB family antitoxin [Thermoflexales bacterium]